MTKPSTVAAISVLVCTPALISFASGTTTAMSLGIWYLASLLGVAAGAHLLQRLVTSYTREQGKDDR
jgi:hypothetical protein